MTNFFSELANLGLKAANLQLVFGDNIEGMARNYFTYY